MLIMFLIGVSGCGYNGSSKNNFITFDASEIDTTLQKTTIRFTAKEHDFGQVKEGNKVVCVFEAINTGDADLLFQNVSASCGCTMPKYDKKPIRPGNKGAIEVTFDTKGRPGIQRKTVLVVSNTEPPNTVLSFICEVITTEK